MNTRRIEEEKNRNKVRKVNKKKAWALVSQDGYIPNRFEHAHSVFAPRVYSTEEGAQSVANRVETGGPKLKVIPCEINYKLP